jgi:hypothetical protein
MNTSKWIAVLAGVALVTGVAIAGAKSDATEHKGMGMSCGMMAKGEMENCPMHAAKAEAEPMGCCQKEEANPASCPMHAEAKAAAPSCHGDHAAAAPDAKEAPAHAGHH